jgi:protein-S-isoprenylcysteine O-methyltransferase Ste14
MDRDVAIRVAALYLPVAAAVACWLRRPPGRRLIGGVLLGIAWNVATLVPLQLAAARFDWWSFATAGGSRIPVPAELIVGWAIAWGAVPVLLNPRPRLGVLVAVAAAADILLMPRLAPVLALGDRWLAGEIVALGLCLVPGSLLGWWMADDRQLGWRASLQVIAFALLVGTLLPAAIVALTSEQPLRVHAGPSWLLLQLVFLLALPGVSAVQEFVERGGGTPIPFDPPKRLVTSGVYAYVANPMQLSMALCYLAIGGMLRSWEVALAGVMSVAYAEGIARWDEDRDLAARSGERWTTYRRAVRRWHSRWKPWYPGDIPAARLYVADDCVECSQLGRWLAARQPVGLEIVAARTHARAPLSRIIYEPMDGTREAEGVAAVARALEHLSLGWALIGMLARLPVLVVALQLFTDASGGEPRLGGSTSTS